MITMCNVLGPRNEFVAATSGLRRAGELLAGPSGRGSHPLRSKIWSMYASGLQDIERNRCVAGKGTRYRVLHKKR